MPEKAARQPQEGVLKLDLWADMSGFERWHSCAIFRCSGLVLCARVFGHRGGHGMVLVLARAPSSGAGACHVHLH